MLRSIEVVALSIESIRTVRFLQRDFVVSIVPATRQYAEDMTPQNVLDHKQYVITAFDDIKKEVEEYTLFAAEHAKVILFAIEQAITSKLVDRIICHCTAGLSRSPAIAIALSLIFNLQPSAHQLLKQHLAFNEHVLMTMLNTWRNMTLEYTIRSIWR